MRHRDLNLALEEGVGKTLAQRVASTVERAILDGRLEAGKALPGSRVLADMLGVTRNTVIAALLQLVEEGWLETEASRGTFVSARPPKGAGAAPRAAEAAEAPGFDVPSRLAPLSAPASGALSLGEGLPDARLAPTEALAKAYQRALRRHGENLLQYGEPMGNRLLRESIAAWVSERHGVAVSPERVLVTRGSRTALTLISLALLREGDTVAVEDPGNRGAWDIFRQCPGVALQPVPLDGEGVRPEALEPLLARGGVRALYLTPRRQFPTGAAMGAERGRALLDLALRHRLALLEDDYDGAYHYGERAPLPLLSLDTTGQVIHIGSLSRLLAPGLRLGYLIAPAGLVDRLARVRRSLEWQGDRVLEWAVADLIRDGELSRHLRRVHKVYAGRRDHLVALLRQELGEHLDLASPEGGLGLWMRVREGLDPEAWTAAAARCGLLLLPPRHYCFGEPGPCLRMGFSQVDEDEAVEAVRRLKAALGMLAHA